MVSDTMSDQDGQQPSAAIVPAPQDGVQPAPSPSSIARLDEGYTDRTETEMEALADHIGFGEKHRVRGMPYVAQPAPGYDVHGVWHSFGAAQRSGYASHAIGLHWALMKLGVQTQLIPHRNIDIDIDELPVDRAERISSWLGNAVGHPHLVVLSWQPDVAAEMANLGPPLIPYCAFEATKISDLIVSVCNNDAFREIWVVSQFVHEAMVNSGIDAMKVRTVPPVLFGGPWPIGARDVHLSRAARSRPVTSDAPFVFGAFGTWHKRKGVHELIRAYFSSFKRSEPVTLRLHTSPLGARLTIKQFREKVIAEIAEIATEFGDYEFPASKKMPHIRLDLGTDESDREVIEWLAQLDCYANASFGEGLGIPQIWSKALGVPMVSTSFGAIGDIILASDSDIDNETLVPSKLGPVPVEMMKMNAMFCRESCWGDYEVADLAKQLRVAFERGRVFDERGAEYVQREYDGRKTVEVLSRAFRELMPASELKAVAPALTQSNVLTAG